MLKKFLLLGFAITLVISSEVLANNHALSVSQTTNINQLIGQYNISPYVNNIEAKLKGNWFPPKYGEKVEVSFKVLKDGKYKDLKIVQPSRYKSDNQAALDAVMFTFPLEPIPTAENELTINYTFPGQSRTR